MHITGNQLDARNEMYALEAAAKSEAKKSEDERTRRKLLIAAASSLPGEAEDCVVRLSGEAEGEQHAEAQGGEDRDEQNTEEEASGEDVWA
jgi:hypothetical protein